MNKLYFGDNLEVLQEFESDSIDLVCTDPPFNSGRNYNTFLPNSQAQKKAFVDTWTWDDAAKEARQDIEEKAQVSDSYHRLDNALKGYDLVLQNGVSGSQGSMRAYLAFMGARLIELHRVLKSTGCIYLHCDPTASHYLKVILDGIFGVKNFRNEIVWERTNAHNMKARYFSKIHDLLLFYSKGDRYVWNKQYTEYSDAQLSRYKTDEGGRLYTGRDLTMSTVMESRNFEWRGSRPPAHRSWGASLEQLEKWYVEGRILLKRDGTPRLDGLKVYLDELPGKQISSIWNDIPRIGNTSKERLGYPTQKPLTLYERMIKASSNEDDLVLDPFCGGGTTIDAAETLNRRWIGIDLTILALDPMQKRMHERHGLKPSIDYSIDGYPTNMQEVRKLVRDEKKYHDFANWAVTRLGLEPTQNVNDGGFDGIGNAVIWNPRNHKEINTRVIAEVKSGKPSLTQVRAFCHSMKMSRAEVGIFITIEPVSRGMKQIQESEGVFEHNGLTYPRLQFWQIDDNYFENPESINQVIRLPWMIAARNKSDRHIEGYQTMIPTVSR